MHAALSSHQSYKSLSYAGAGMGGSAFMRSLFDFQNFQARINCVRPSFASSDRKEQAAKQAEESRNMEVVQMVVGMVVCDVLHALLTPRPGQTACPIDADTAHATVQLAFQRFNPQERQSAVAIHPELHQALHQGMVRRWSEVLCHLSLSRFDQITGELVGRVHSVKGADDVINYLVGTQRLTILSLWGPSVGPFVDLFKQLACLHKPPFNSPLVRLCLLHNIELAVRKIDCSSPDDSSATAPIFASSASASFGQSPASASDSPEPPRFTALRTSAMEMAPRPSTSNNAKTARSSFRRASPFLANGPMPRRAKHTSRHSASSDGLMSGK